MRTTVNIDDNVLTDAKLRARRRGVSLGQVIEEALRRDRQASDERPDLPPVPIFKGTGVCPGVDLSSNRSVAEYLDRDQDLEQLR